MIPSSDINKCGVRMDVTERAAANDIDYRVAIVGLGPRGLAMVERILAHAKREETWRLEVLLFSEGAPGPGCHHTDQSRFLLLNTAADQITQFPTVSRGSPAAATGGPAFAQWLKERIKAGDIGCVLTEEGASIDDSYQPRALYGEYLKDAFVRLRQSCPQQVRLRLIKYAATAAERRESGKWMLRANNEVFADIDFLHLATGHNLPRTWTPEPKTVPWLIDDPFPVAQRLADVKATATVAIEGMGLAAFDVIAELTLGRGGRFVTAGAGELTYVPSGQEPKLMVFSRSGLPLRARPSNQKTFTGRPDVRHFTEEKVAALRAKGPIDFEKTMLPLLVRDMEDAYYGAMVRSGGFPEDLIAKLEDGSWKDVPDWVERVARNVPLEARFSWKKLTQPVPADALVTAAAFAKFFRDYLRDDIVEAGRGNVTSPIKAACDVLRDLRERIAEAVDFKGLTGESQAWFYGVFLSQLKRLSVGPPKARIAQLMALIDAGVVRADFGPEAICEVEPDGWRLRSRLWPQHAARADVLVRARVAHPNPVGSPLLRGLIADGHARRFSNGVFSYGGLEVTRSMNVVSRDGAVVSNLWATGVVTEGTRFYTYVLPRPNAPGRFEDDAEAAARAMFDQIFGAEALINTMDEDQPALEETVK